MFSENVKCMLNLEGPGADPLHFGRGPTVQVFLMQDGYRDSVGGQLAAFLQVD